MIRIFAVVVILAVLVPIRMCMTVSGNASYKVEDIAQTVSSEARRHMKKARRALQVNSRAVAKTLKNDVNTMKDSVDAGVKDMKGFLASTLGIKQTPAPRKASPNTRKQSSVLPARYGIDLTIVGALVFMFVRPWRRR